MYYKYFKEFQGDSILVDGIKYDFVSETGTLDKKTGKLKRIKYRYIEVLTEDQAKQQRASQREREKKLEYLGGRLAKIDNKKIIIRVNKEYNGKIQGKSSVSSSIYSNLKIKGKKIRLRVSKHDVFTKRSESDISVVIHPNSLDINSDHITFFLEDQTVNQIENMIYKKIIKFITKTPPDEF